MGDAAERPALDQQLDRRSTTKLTLMTRVNFRKLPDVIGLPRDESPAIADLKHESFRVIEAKPHRQTVL
jgi:hypothetical protein